MSTDTVTPLRQRMIEDMNARKLSAGTQRGTFTAVSGSLHPQAIARHGHDRGHPPVPAASNQGGREHLQRQQDILFKTAPQTLVTIAADPKHLGARIGLTAVLHTWGSALTITRISM
jgi:hypothetical protein